MYYNIPSWRELCLCGPNHWSSPSAIVLGKGLSGKDECRPCGLGLGFRVERHHYDMYGGRRAFMDVRIELVLVVA